MKYFLTTSGFYMMPFLRYSLAIFICALALTLAGCTSLGHENRTEPQIERQLATRPDRVVVVGSGELVIAVEKLLVSKGIDVRLSQIPANSNPSVPASEHLTRYAMTVTSVDQDMCVPEGSRQMHFYISVVDTTENQRVFAMSGDYGCKDTIVSRFEKWFFSQ